MLMPSLVLSTAIAAYLMRHTRSAMLEALSADYVRTARAKGASERIVVLRHALRNARMPIVTLVTILFGELLAGAVLTRSEEHTSELQSLMRISNAVFCLK